MSEIINNSNVFYGPCNIIAPNKTINLKIDNSELFKSINDIEDIKNHSFINGDTRTTITIIPTEIWNLSSLNTTHSTMGKRLFYINDLKSENNNYTILGKIFISKSGYGISIHRYFLLPQTLEDIEYTEKILQTMPEEDMYKTPEYDGILGLKDDRGSLTYDKQTSGENVENYKLSRNCKSICICKNNQTQGLLFQSISFNKSHSQEYSIGGKLKLTVTYDREVNKGKYFIRLDNEQYTQLVGDFNNLPTNSDFSYYFSINLTDKIPSKVGDTVDIECDLYACADVMPKIISTESYKYFDAKSVTLQPVPLKILDLFPNE